LFSSSFSQQLFLSINFFSSPQQRHGED
jgi:hypothetical protein